MKSTFFIKATEIAKQLIDMKLQEGSIAVDATIGNGHDTLFLAKKVGETGFVYGFDIQDLAIEKTSKRINDAGYSDRVKIIKESHENIDSYVKEPVDLFIFNLGYLPGGDHEIITKPDSTVSAIEKALNLLNGNGILLVVLYYGHDGGELEKEVVENYLKNLDQKQYNVLKFNFINQKNKPPILIGVEKKN